MLCVLSLLEDYNFGLNLVIADFLVICFVLFVYIILITYI